VAALLGDAAVAAPAEPVADTGPHGAGHMDNPCHLPDDPCGQVAPAAPLAPTAQAPVGSIASRSHAYRLLEEIADYLAQHEPHSPTPYLLRRAISWGSMPLAELMRDILRDEGDVGRYLALLERR
jgi:type VI secretion system protein ImpA